MNKSQKPTRTVPRQLTEEQRLAQRAQIYLQKKESYALNAALKMLEGQKTVSKKAIDKIVENADYFAEQLLEKLFNQPQDENPETDNNEED